MRARWRRRRTGSNTGSSIEPATGSGGAGASGGRPARAAAADTIARSAAAWLRPSSAACWKSGAAGARSGTARTRVNAREPDGNLRARRAGAMRRRRELPHGCAALPSRGARSPWPLSLCCMRRRRNSGPPGAAHACWQPSLADQRGSKALPLPAQLAPYPATHDHGRDSTGLAAKLGVRYESSRTACGISRSKPSGPRAEVQPVSTTHHGSQPVTRCRAARLAQGGPAHAVCGRVEGGGVGQRGVWRRPGQRGEQLLVVRLELGLKLGLLSADLFIAS